jgi:hypothetical protein
MPGTWKMEEIRWSCSACGYQTGPLHASKGPPFEPCTCDFEEATNVPR